jgi:rod shape determining protein RodA
MKSILLHFRKLDWILIASALLLTGMGLLSLYSSSMGRGNFIDFQKQFIFAGIGIVLMFLFSFFDYRIFRNDPYLLAIIYVLGLAALAGLFFFAPEIRGVRSWYRLGPVSLDPTEFIKIILIILLAKYFSLRHIELYRIRHIFLSGLYVLLPSILVFLQPDLGSVIILVILWLGILIVSGIRLKTFLVLLLCGAIISLSGWAFWLKDYQKDRILNIIFPQSEPLGIGWSQIQAKIAIGSGEVFGQGLGKGSQTQYGFLPEPHTDFIFSAIAEEFGLIAVVALLFLFVILISRIIKVALSSQFNSPRLFAAGFAILLATQVFINIGMNLGILPVIGITLPLVSYGGSSLLAVYIGCGIVLSIRSRILFHS